MIRISKQADYGIVLLSHFVTDLNHATYTARDLAGISRLPLPMVGKILKSLAKQGLLVSHRGVKGGYGLARPAEAISIADIISALDGPIAITTCSAHEGDCEYEHDCPARSNWFVINHAIRSALRNISLKQMARPEAHLFQPAMVPGTEATKVVACTCGMSAPGEGERLNKEIA